MASPPSLNTAPPARCATSAPMPPVAAPSASASSKPPWHEPATARPTPAGKRTTGPTDPRSNASSPTSCGDATAEDALVSAGNQKSTPTSTFSPPPPTSPGSPRSDFAPPPPDGRSAHERTGPNSSTAHQPLARLPPPPPTRAPAPTTPPPRQPHRTRHDL